MLPDCSAVILHLQLNDFSPLSGTNTAHELHLCQGRFHSVSKQETSMSVSLIDIADNLSNRNITMKRSSAGAGLLGCSNENCVDADLQLCCSAAVLVCACVLALQCL
jgi:hypothetical protein